MIDSVTKSILVCPICAKTIGTCKCAMFDILSAYVGIVSELQIELQQAHGQINMLKQQIENVLGTAQKRIDPLRKEEKPPPSVSPYGDIWKERVKRTKKEEVIKYKDFYRKLEGGKDYDKDYEIW